MVLTAETNNKLSKAQTLKHKRKNIVALKFGANLKIKK